ncbi:MAG: C10 family peptidase [Bacteroidales bacterium]|nr:C10 family peptidase [Bacteroidales bacterium]
MNFRSFFAATLLLALSLNLPAKTITSDEAKKAARNFLYLTMKMHGESREITDIRLANTYIYKTGDQPVFFAFDTDPGFIIISAEDGFTPVLGYSFHGKFEFENASAHYKGFLLNYAEQIIHVRDNNLEPTPAFAAIWKELRTDDIALVPITRERDVAPMLFSTWDQGYPYNILCPADPNGPNGYVWVGCVATAMAQIMYYWRYPETGTSQHCYTPSNPSYGQQCANFSQTQYKFDGMINSIDNRNPQPNAELQYHCAVSVNMSFSPNGSGSYSFIVPDRLNLFWRYNNAQYREKQNYSNSGWINLLKADIDQGYPLYYSGFNSSQGGHAFVCDGYQGDNFHFNFGWSGSGNGYYTLSNVGGFSQDQACVRNFVPSDPNYPYHNTGTKILTQKSGSFTDGSGPIANYLDNITASWLIDPQTIYDSITSITLNFSSFDVLSGDSVKIYDGGTTSDALLGAFSGNGLPEQMTSSFNKMLIVFTTNGNGNAPGWYAEYSTTSPTWCSGLTTFTEPYGTFDDGSGNFYYQGGATCLWRIKPPYAGKITLSFNYFETEEDYDIVSVYDGTTLIGTFSGNTIPEPIIATSGMMTVTWYTNPSNNYLGWEASYEVDNVGLDEKADNKELIAYPNPVSSNLFIAYHSEKESDVIVKLANLTGQVMYNRQFRASSGMNQHTISMQSYQAGIYFLSVKTENSLYNKKIIVQ